MQNPELTPATWYDVSSGITLGISGSGPDAEFSAGLPVWPSGKALDPSAGGSGALRAGYSFSCWLRLAPDAQAESYTLLSATDGVRTLQWSLVRYAQGEEPASPASDVNYARYAVRMSATFHRHEGSAITCTGTGAGNVQDVLLYPGKWHHVALSHEWAPHSAGSFLARGLAGLGLLSAPSESTPLIVTVDGIVAHAGKERYPNMQPLALRARGAAGDGTAQPAVQVSLAARASVPVLDEDDVNSALRGSLTSAALFAASLPTSALMYLHSAGLDASFPLPIFPYRTDGSRAPDPSAAIAVEEAHRCLLFALNMREGTQQQVEGAVISLPCVRAGDAARIMERTSCVQALASSKGVRFMLREGMLEGTPPSSSLFTPRGQCTRLLVSHLAPSPLLSAMPVSSEALCMPISMAQAYGLQGGPCGVAVQTVPYPCIASCDPGQAGRDAWEAYCSHAAHTTTSIGQGSTPAPPPPPHWLATMWNLQASGNRWKLVPKTGSDAAARAAGGGRAGLVDQLPPLSPVTTPHRSLGNGDAKPLLFSRSEVDLMKLGNRDGSAVITSLGSCTMTPTDSPDLRARTDTEVSSLVSPNMTRQLQFSGAIDSASTSLDTSLPSSVDSASIGTDMSECDMVEGSTAQGQGRRVASHVLQFPVHAVAPLRRTPGILTLFSDCIEFVPTADEAEAKDKDARDRSEEGGGSNEDMAPPPPWSSRKAYIAAILPPSPPLIIPMPALVSMEIRLHHLRAIGLELTYTRVSSGWPASSQTLEPSAAHACASCLVAFDSPDARDTFAAAVLKRRPPLLAPFLPSISAVREAALLLAMRWKAGLVSNLDYLCALNRLAGRTVHDLAQYPVLPWVIADYASQTLDLQDPATFRDLAWPIGAQTSSRREALRKKYAFLKQQFDEATGQSQSTAASPERPEGNEDVDATPVAGKASARTIDDEQLFVGPPFHFGCLYMKPGTVAWYMVRIEPYTSLHIACSDGRFDHADRLFHSVGDAYASAASSDSDIRELIPEAYLSRDGSWLTNGNGVLLGIRQDGVALDDVVLPPWAHGDPSRFSAIMRAALESRHVTDRLHLWVDLTFGHKASMGSRCAAAAVNVYHGLMHARFIDSERLARALAEEVQEEMRTAAVSGRKGRKGAEKGRGTGRPELGVPSTLALLVSRVDTFRDEFGVLPLQLFKKRNRRSTRPGAEGTAPPAIRGDAQALASVYPNNGGPGSLRFGRSPSARQGDSFRLEELAFPSMLDGSGRTNEGSDAGPGLRSARVRALSSLSADASSVGDPDWAGNGESKAAVQVCKHDADATGDCESNDPERDVNPATLASGRQPHPDSQAHASTCSSCRAPTTVEEQDEVDTPPPPPAHALHALQLPEGLAPDVCTIVHCVLHKAAGPPPFLGRGMQERAQGVACVLPVQSVVDMPSGVLIVRRTPSRRSTRPVYLIGGIQGAGASAGVKAARRLGPEAIVNLPGRLTCLSIAPRIHPALASGAAGLCTLTHKSRAVVVQQVMHLQPFNPLRPAGDLPGSSALDPSVRAALTARAGEWLVAGTAEGEVHICTLHLLAGGGKEGRSKGRANARPASGSTVPLPAFPPADATCVRLTLLRTLRCDTVTELSHAHVRAVSVHAHVDRVAAVVGGSTAANLAGPSAVLVWSLSTGKLQECLFMN